MQPNRNSRLRRRQLSILFALADAVFLMGVGSAANATMMFVHSLEWNCVGTLVLGMVAAMGVQMILATIAAPVLGSIETMVPSMVVGMFSPMLICVMEAIRGGSMYGRAAGSGAAFGLLVFVTLSVWARAHKPLISLEATLRGD